MLFEELGLGAPLLRAVATEGYTTPTPIQTRAIPPIVEGRDLLGCAQTGTGKTAAFALPILHRLLADSDSQPSRSHRLRALILSPTRELAGQIGESFAAYGRYTGLRHTVVYGGVGQQPQVRALQRGVDILVATPGRLLDLMQQGFVHLDQIETFVLDEADRMLDMGFLPDLRRIIAKLPAERQNLLFSATMPEPIERLARTILRNPASVRIAPVKATTELIEQSVFFVPREQKSSLLVSYLTERGVARALVFTRTKRGADRVSKQLKRCGIRADAIHGDKSQAARQRALSDFKLDRTQVLVATDLAARGIDVDGISHVLNYDIPEDAETYVHRIGRTGRAGASGVAVSFCGPDDRGYLKAIERLTRSALNVETDLVATLQPIPSEAPRVAAPKLHAAGQRPRKHLARAASDNSTSERSGHTGLQGPIRKKKRRMYATGKR